MKKRCFLILMTGILFSLSACGVTSGPSASPQPTAGNEPSADPAPAIEPSPLPSSVPEPSPEPVNEENTALLVIDIQNDYFDGGSHTLYNAPDALANAEAVLAKFRDSGLPVIHVQHNNGPDASFFAEGSWGMEIHENLTPLENEPVVVKRQVSSFAGTELEEILREGNIDKLVIVGMQTNLCIQAAVKDGDKLGFELFLLEDACAALSLELHDSIIESLREFATVMKTGEYK